MAAIDKINEFYTCAKRFTFLAQRDTYRPITGDFGAIDFPKEVHDALDTICLFFSNSPEFLKRAEEAEEFFQEAEEQNQNRWKAEMLAQIVKDCCR